MSQFLDSESPKVWPRSTVALPVVSATPPPRTKQLQRRRLSAAAADGPQADFRSADFRSADFRTADRSADRFAKRFSAGMSSSASPVVARPGGRGEEGWWSKMAATTADRLTADRSTTDRSTADKSAERSAGKHCAGMNSPVVVNAEERKANDGWWSKMAATTADRSAADSTRADRAIAERGSAVVQSHLSSPAGTGGSRMIMSEATRYYCNSSAQPSSGLYKNETPGIMHRWLLFWLRGKYK